MVVLRFVVVFGEKERILHPSGFMEPAQALIFPQFPHVGKIGNSTDDCIGIVFQAAHHGCIFKRYIVDCGQQRRCVSRREHLNSALLGLPFNQIHQQMQSYRVDTVVQLLEDIHPLRVFAEQSGQYDEKAQSTVRSTVG